MGRANLTDVDTDTSIMSIERTLRLSNCRPDIMVGEKFTLYNYRVFLFIL